MQDKKQQLELDMKNRLVPNQVRSMSRLYIVKCLFNVYAEYIMQNAWLDKAQAEIKIAGRNINDLRYADDITLIAESKNKLKKVGESEREEWKSWLKTQHSEN